jgi:hypothetical protein
LKVIKCHQIKNLETHLNFKNMLPFWRHDLAVALLARPVIFYEMLQSNWATRHLASSAFLLWIYVLFSDSRDNGGELLQSSVVTACNIDLYSGTLA